MPAGRLRHLWHSWVGQPQVLLGGVIVYFDGSHFTRTYAPPADAVFGSGCDLDFRSYVTSRLLPEDRVYDSACRVSVVQRVELAPPTLVALGVAAFQRG